MRRQVFATDVQLMLHLMRRETDLGVKSLLLEDIAWTSRQITPEVADAAIQQASVWLLPNYAREMLAGSSVADVQPGRKKKTVDVMIVAIKEPELDAALLAFGLEIGQDPTDTFRNASFWETEVSRAETARPLQVVITAAGRSGLLEMASFLHSAFAAYAVKSLVILVGMAAGVEGRVEKGDVVIAERVVDYGRGVLAPEGFEPAPKTYNLHPSVVQTLAYFNPIRRGWRGQVRQLVERVAASSMEGKPKLPTVPIDTIAPDFHDGVILAGNFFIEDGSLGAIAKGLLERKGLAGEMEGAGLAEMCEAEHVPWMVVRGIADFGNREVDPDTDEPIRDRSWQFVASLAAATTAALYLVRTTIFDQDGDF